MKKQTDNKTNAIAKAGEPNAVLKLALRHEKDTEDMATAAALTNPAVNSAVTIQRLEAQLNVNALVSELTSHVAAVNGGKMERPEAMLMAQAETLEALFHNLARRALTQDGLAQYETHMRLALKAQSQSRAALEALAEIKNPRSVAFVKQANIAAGHQQVNNMDNQTFRAGAHGRTEENEIRPNKLLTDTSYETVDTRGTLAASRAHSAMEAVGAINGAADEAG
jgi:hypothetical protein